MTMTENILTRLRQSNFNVENEKKLLEHPFVKAASGGTLTKQHLTNLICEQYTIQKFDQKSLEMMAQRSKDGGLIKCEEFFCSLVDSEKHAGKLLLKTANWLKLTQDYLEMYECKIRAQAYPSFLSRCALYEPVSYVVAACAVNFPTFGKQCGMVYRSLKSSSLFGKIEDSDIEFMSYFDTPIEGFDDLAIECLHEEGIVYNSKLESVVRLIQEAEVLFWDSVFII